MHPDYERLTNTASFDSHLTAVLILMIFGIASASSFSSYDPQYAFGQAYPGVDGDKVFSSDRSGSFDIWKISETNFRPTESRPRVNLDAAEVSPSLSPDGSEIVFVRGNPENRPSTDAQDGFFPGAGNINIARLNGANFRQCYSDPPGPRGAALEPTFSPDGKFIVFSKITGFSRVGDEDYPLYDIFIMDAKPFCGIHQRRLLQIGSLASPSPSFKPDGSKIVFSTGGGLSTADFNTATGAARNVRPLLEESSGSFDYQPSWSPDGSKIVFVTNRDRVPLGDEWGIAVVNSDGTNIRGINGVGGLWVDLYPSWSPDGSKIVYSSESNCTGGESCVPGDFELWEANANGRCCPMQLTFNNANDLQPMWGPKLVPDTDGDGIHDNVDYNIIDNIDERTITSNRFSDVPLGGKTSGSVARFQVLLDITEARNPQGVNIRGFIEMGFPSGPDPSVVTVNTCPAGTRITDGSMVNIVNPNREFIVTCSSLDLTVLLGPIPTVLTADDGSTAKLDVPARNSISFDPTTGTLTAGPGNIDTLNVIFVVGDVEQEPRPLLPGGSLVVNTVPPETTIDSATDSQGNPIQDGSRTPSQDIFFEFSSPASDVSIIECSLDSQTWEACTNNVAGYDNLAEGPHTFEVRARDGANNIDPTPDVFSWTIDTIPPETIIDSATDGQGNPIQNQSSTLSTDISFQFSSPDSDDVSVFECSLDGGDWELCPGRLAGVIFETEVHSYNHLQLGEHIFEVRAKDGAGNVDPTPATRIWTVTSAEEPLPPTNASDMTPPKL